MKKRLSTSSWKNKYDIQNRSVLNKVGTPITCWTQLGIQAKSFESLARCPQGHRCLLLKEKRPLNSVGVLSITGGDRGIRTLDTGLSPYASLAGKCLRPLGQVSNCGQGVKPHRDKGGNHIFWAGFGQSKSHNPANSMDYALVFLLRLVSFFFILLFHND